MKRFKPIRITRHRGVGIADHDGQNFLIQFHRQLKRAAMEALHKTVRRPRAFGIKMHARTFGQPFAAALQCFLRIVRLDHDVTAQFASDAQHGRIEHAFLRRLSHVGWETYREHHVHGGLMIADDYARWREELRREIILQFAERHGVHNAATQ